MMTGEKRTRAVALQALQDAVDEACTYYTQVNANLFDGSHTAHELLESAVFWHCEYLKIAQALAAHRDPELHDGSLADLRQAGCEQLRTSTMGALVAQLRIQQAALDEVLRVLPDWQAPFPITEQGRATTVEDRVFALAQGIRNTVNQLRRAEFTKQIRSTLN